MVAEKLKLKEKDELLQRKYLGKAMIYSKICSSKDFMENDIINVITQLKKFLRKI